MSDDETMDVPAALEELNRALRLQRRSVMQFLLAAGGSKGIEGMSLSDQLWRYAEAEFADTRMLVSKIVALGGEPDLTNESLEYVKDIGKTLDHLIEIEEETLAALHAVIPHTGQEPGSEALEHLVEHLIMRKQNQLDFLIRARD